MRVLMMVQNRSRRRCLLGEEIVKILKARLADNRAKNHNKALGCVKLSKAERRLVQQDMSEVCTCRRSRRRSSARMRRPARSRGCDHGLEGTTNRRLFSFSRQLGLQDHMGERAVARVEALGIGMGVSMDLAKITAGAALELLNDVEHGPETACPGEIASRLRLSILSHVGGGRCRLRLLWSSRCTGLAYGGVTNYTGRAAGMPGRQQESRAAKPQERFGDGRRRMSERMALDFKDRVRIAAAVQLYGRACMDQGTADFAVERGISH